MDEFNIKRIIPIEVEKQSNTKYCRFHVPDESMNDGSRMAFHENDEILCREVKREFWNSQLHIENWLFVIVHESKGVIVKQIIEHDVDTNEIVCHSLNPLFEDFTLHLDGVLELYNIIKIIDRKNKLI